MTRGANTYFGLVPQQWRSAVGTVDRYDCWLVIFLIGVWCELGFRVLHDPQSMASDPVGHYLDSVKIITDVWNSSLFTIRVHYPPFVSIVAVPFNLLFDFDEKVALIGTQGLFLVSLLGATYLIGKRLYSGAIGLAAAVILFLYPTVYGQSGIFMLDVPLAAMVAITLWLVLKTEGFSDARYGIPLGLVLGFGMWTKPTFCIFVVPAMCFYLVSNLYCDRVNGVVISKNSRWAAFIKPVVIGGIIASVWYLPRLRDLFGNVWHDAIIAMPAQGELAPTSFQGLVRYQIYYFQYLWINTSVPLMVAFVPAGLYMLRNRIRGKYFLLSWLIGASILCGLMPAVEPRYFLPALPAVALITAAGLAGLYERGAATKWATGIVAAGLVTWAAVQLYAQSYGVSYFPAGRMIPSRPLESSPFIVFSQHHSYVDNLSEPQFNIDPIWRALRRAIIRSGRHNATVALFVPWYIRSALWLPIDTWHFRHKKPSIVAIDNPTNANRAVDYIVLAEGQDPNVVAAEPYFSGVLGRKEYQKLWHGRIQVGYGSSSWPLRVQILERRAEGRAGKPQKGITGPGSEVAEEEFVARMGQVSRSE